MTYGLHGTRGHQPEGSIRRLFPEPLGAKVPQITALFWVVKILTTAGGEATSGFLALGNWTVGGSTEVALLAIGLIWQFSIRRYQTVAYWFLAYAIATFGTGVADGLHVLIGIPYEGTTVLWALVLAVILWSWYRSEGTLSIHSIVTRRRECFYWATVFATFALGTAVGDFTATVLGLGYLSAGITFGVVILVPLVLWSGLKVNSVFCFWFAYVLTRPLGASFADYASKPPKISGAGFGYGPSAAVAAILVAVLVGYLAISRTDVQREGEPVPGGGPDAGRPRDHRRVSYRGL
jgi:uncharacterized membrane-anchored protein